MRDLKAASPGNLHLRQVDCYYYVVVTVAGAYAIFSCLRLPALGVPSGFHAMKSMNDERDEKNDEILELRRRRVFISHQVSGFLHNVAYMSSVFHHLSALLLVCL